MELIVRIFLIIYIVLIKCDLKNSSNIEIDKKSANKRLLTGSQNLNNIIEIYNPYDTVAYISSINNQNGDLFITTNSEGGDSDKRLIYALNSDGTNYFSDTNLPFLVLNSLSPKLYKYPCSVII